MTYIHVRISVKQNYLINKGLKLVSVSDAKE